jgi:hypothetical protein
MLLAEAILVCHPATPCGAVSGIRVGVTATPQGGLAFDYILHGDPARLTIPAPQPPAAVDGLWRRTCCEAFLARSGEAAYREFNFSPSSQWAGYAFGAYRQRTAWEPPAPQIVVEQGADLRLCATLPREALPEGGSLRLGLAVVVEDQRGVLSYWALRHPAGKPDFHHRDGFALQLPDPRIA